MMDMRPLSRSLSPPLRPTPLCWHLLAWWLWIGVGGVVALNLLVATPLLCMVDCAVHVTTHSTAHGSHLSGVPAQSVCCIGQPPAAHVDDLEACYPAALALIVLFVFWGVRTTMAPALAQRAVLWMVPPPLPPPRWYLAMGTTYPITH